MRDFIERLRAKPEHVRKQIALGFSGAVTGVVALGWLVSLGAGGTLALDAATPENNPGEDISELANETRTGFSQLMGAAAAFTGEEPAELQVLESNTRSTLDRNQQEVDTRTVIPF